MTAFGSRREPEHAARTLNALIIIGNYIYPKKVMKTHENMLKKSSEKHLKAKVLPRRWSCFRGPGGEVRQDGARGEKLKMKMKP